MEKLKTKINYLEIFESNFSFCIDPSLKKKKENFDQNSNTIKTKM
jgi:hypothetical protein